MGFFSSKASWTEQARARDKERPRTKNKTWTQQADNNAKERTTRIKAANALKRQQRRDLAKRNLIRGAPTWSEVQRGANRKALARAQDKRDKKAAKKAANRGKFIYWD